jgi:hexosaminidase
MKYQITVSSLSIVLGAGVVLMAISTRAVAGSPPAVIPAPQKVECGEGTFQLGANSRILVDRASRETGEYLAERLRASTGYPLKVHIVGNTASEKRNLGNIILTTHDAQAALGAEGYQLSATANEVVIHAPNQAGLFYGVQTLLQLLPAEIFASKPVQGMAWTVPVVQIEDTPRFKWRGLMLDVSRHFFTKAEVKEMLDLMAMQKLNTFHWHLVDDQGWRIEIKKYPRLTEVGAWRNDIGFGLDPKSSTAYGPDGRYGGYYTQADIREIVAYAASRHITIVPEIEMPGHSAAALTSYPEFSCTGGPFTTDAGGKMGIYCAGNDGTFEFLQNVLTEVMELFPGKYIHIGGDEVEKEYWAKCPKCQARMEKEGLKTVHELQSYFIRRMETFINAHSRTLIGWTEIREGGLAKNAVVMDWIGGAVESARDGHDVVMSPTRYCYLDHYQSTNHTTEPHAIGDYLPLSRVYAFEPVPAKLDATYDSHILGAQGNLWTEYVGSFKHAQYMIFPRMCAMAEVTWSPAGTRDWAGFCRRLAAQELRFDQVGINYRKGVEE